MTAYVIWLQQALKVLGYDPGEIDGREGVHTAAAVRRFQADQGLVVDGIVGVYTNQALLIELKSAIIPRSETVAVLKNFTPDEFTCVCGCGLDVRFDLKIFAQQLRDAFGWPLTISSGARCPTVNGEAGGVPDSCHLTGEAFDAYFSGQMDEDIMAQMADLAVGQGMGVIRYPNQLFCHFQLAPRNDFSY